MCFKFHQVPTIAGMIGTIAIISISECVGVDSIMKKLALQLFTENESNLVMSPLLIRFGMCKLASVAKGASLSELLAALGVHAEFQLKKCFQLLKGNMKMLIRFNAIWKNVLFVKFTNISDKFIKNSSTEFGVEIYKIGFDLPKTAEKFINSWVAAQSLRRITQVIDDGDLDKNTSMVLVNAVYLKTYWEKPFSPKWTKYMNFHKSNNKIISIPMMSKVEGDVLFLEDEELDLKAAEFKLSIYGVFILLVVPNSPQGLPRLLEKMSKDPGFLDSLKSKMERSMVKVLMPRFKIKSYVSWGDFLGQIGVNEIFNPDTNDLSEILKGKGKFHLDKVKQSVFVEIDEGGLPNYDQGKDKDYMELKYNKWDIRDFTIDRPFYFNINLKNHKSLFNWDFLTGVYYGS